MSHLDIGSARAESGLRGPAELQSVSRSAVEVLNSGVEQRLRGDVEHLPTGGVKHVEHLPKGGVKVEQLNTC